MALTRHIKVSYATLLLLLGICAILGLGFIMYKVLPNISEEGTTAWLVSYALILAVVFALFVLGVFLGYFYGNPKSRWLASKKTRKQFREALSFERSERIRLERELYETKRNIIDLKDQLSKKNDLQNEIAASAERELINKIKEEKKELENNQDKLRTALSLRKERIADLLAEIAVAQSEVEEARKEIEQLKSETEPQRQHLKIISKDASLKDILTDVATIKGVQIALVADDFGLVVETSEPGPQSEKLAAVSSLVARESQKIKDLYTMGVIETVTLGDDRGFVLENTYFKLFDLKCALAIVREKSCSYPNLAEQTIEAIISRLKD